MKTFLKPFEEMPQIEELREHLKKDKRIYEVSGLIDSLKPHLIYGIGYDVPIKLIVTFDEMRAKQIYEGYQFFDENTLYYPARDLLFYQSDIHSNALTRERLSVVQALIEHRPVTVVTTMDALMNRVPPLSSYERGIFTIDLEETVDLDEMRKKLVMLGYENVTQVEHPGEFAVRGGIVDIFPLTEEHPIAKVHRLRRTCDGLSGDGTCADPGGDRDRSKAYGGGCGGTVSEVSQSDAHGRSTPDQDRSGTTGDRDQRMGTGAWSGDTSELLCQPDGKSAFLFSAGDSGLFR